MILNYMVWFSNVDVSILPSVLQSFVSLLEEFVFFWASKHYTCHPMNLELTKHMGGAQMTWIFYD
jgi:hypothetical protein